MSLATPTSPTAASSNARVTVHSQEHLSVFDMFKIGVGPSSSHTMGPWRATQRFLELLRQRGLFDKVTRIHCELLGSLSKTGKGHGTDVAVILALTGDDPVTSDTATLDARVAAVRDRKAITLAGQRPGFAFDPATDITFSDHTHPGHPNAMTFTATIPGAPPITQTYFSVGGGFVVTQGQTSSTADKPDPPVSIHTGQDLLDACAARNATIPQIVMANEQAWRTHDQARAGVLDIWHAMAQCVWRGCHTFGTLPGGLGVVRRAGEMNLKLLGVAGGFASDHTAEDFHAWVSAVRAAKKDFTTINKWVSTFALAVNEENACFGRVVTAPTNGAAGVIPAVLMYDYIFNAPGQTGFDKAAAEQRVIDFLLTAGVVGALFKQGATISAAMGGCQAEIGVSSAMAAAGLAQVSLGELATPARTLMAAEIAMEHHLGMTCDPIAGLVQVPCIERNTMGAIKAITATNIASESDPATAKVSFDGVVRTMWHTALDMQTKYKETAEGGLAVNITVGLSEC
jgi:L-serine dehydratase